MKIYLLILLMFFSTNCFCIEQDYFSNHYPSFITYEQSLFSELKNYFDVFHKNAVVFDDSNDLKTYHYFDEKTDQTLHFSFQITRQISENQMIENVGYILNDSSYFTYQIIKNGPQVKPTNDDDLLIFNFSPTDNDQSYQVSIPSFQILMTKSVVNNNEKDFISIGFMEFSLQIETFFSLNEAKLNYIYFFKEMPTPQASLSVRVIDTHNSWNPIQTMLIASNKGEITPSQFFSGLNDGGQAFSEGAKIILKILNSRGFPELGN